MKRFESVVPEGLLAKEQRLDILDDPPEGWHRVAVCTFWSIPSKVRQRWPCAAIVGPLRTVDGIDLLIRNLLLNPQIRVLVLDGKDSSTKQHVMKELTAIWKGGETAHARLRPDILEHALRLFDEVELVWPPEATELGEFDLVALSDRPAGALYLPPPEPKVNARSPHGDPGERVACDLLSQVYPVVLDRILRFGRHVSSQYSPTLELLNLTSVVRDVGRTLAEFQSLSTGQLHPVLGVSWSAVREYYEEDLRGQRVQEDASYGYGARMNAAVAFERAPWTHRVLGRVPGQIERIDQLLRDKPDTRAAYLTPWNPNLDAGLESGRPCLVGVWFRALPSPDGRLHMTLTFRSHDMLRGYPMNIAAACLWLFERAADLGVEPGTVTVHSHSAHLYKNGWEEAQSIVNTHFPHGIRWDPRSLWRVERTADGVRAVAVDPADTGSIIAVLEAPNGAQLRERIERSGLVTEIGGALWLGAEIQKLETRSNLETQLDVQMNSKNNKAE